MEEISLAEKESSDEEIVPIQIGIVIVGNWSRSLKALQYLILLLNTKQNEFEYQLILFEEHVTHIIEMLGPKENELISLLQKNSNISFSKSELKHLLDNISLAIQKDIKKRYNHFCTKQLPKHYIFLSTSKHDDYHFFQHDGSNGYEKTFCKGAIILTGHHCERLAPPTVIEFIFKFIFRINGKNVIFPLEC